MNRSELIEFNGYVGDLLEKAIKELIIDKTISCDLHADSKVMIIESLDHSSRGRLLYFLMDEYFIPLYEQSSDSKRIRRDIKDRTKDTASSIVGGVGDSIKSHVRNRTREVMFTASSDKAMRNLTRYHNSAMKSLKKSRTKRTLSFIGASIFSLEVISLAYASYKSTKNKCDMYTGKKKELCRMKAMKKAKDHINKNMAKCRKTRDPKICAKVLEDKILYWNDRMRAIKRRIRIMR